MDKPTISLSGVFPPIPTPFDAGGEVACQALAENLAQRLGLEPPGRGEIRLAPSAHAALCSAQRRGCTGTLDT